MTELEKAIEHLKREYEKAQKMDFVKDPICYALNHTWRRFDVKRRKKEEKKND